VTAPVTERGTQQRGTSIGRAAVMIGVITVLARLVGFGRQVVFAHTVGTTCLGTAYTTANMVPNIIYDIVLGGALTSVVVPVLAGPAGAAIRDGHGDPGSGDPGAARQARQIASALLTWSAVLLIPVSAALALAARPLVSLLLTHADGCSHAAMTAVATRMLIVFAPQVLLYGMAVVLYGVLQAHRKFGGPAVAPLLSSLVVVAAYAAFGAAGGAYVNRLTSLPPFADYLLSGGTTLGVLAMVAAAAVPAWRLRLGMRPTLRFPPGVGERVRRLAIAGVFTLIAQDASAAAVIVLANRYGEPGALVIYGFAWAVFAVPYAVLAVPIATSAFPELSARARGGPAASGTAMPQSPGAPRDGFDATSAAATRAILLASWLGAAALIGARLPLAGIFESHSAPAAASLALALAAFAPGMIGYGLSANLSRVLYAQGRNRASALAVGLGWVLVSAADVAIVPFVPRDDVVPALGVGTSVGLTLAGVALLLLVRRARGTVAVAGGLRAFLAGLLGCAVSALAGAGLSAVVRGHGFVANIGISALVTLVIAVVFTVIVVNLDGGDLRALLGRLRARAALRPRPRT
jgi:peptidoglycan biosynthesis protein MviN/MurJ (putative lipid II flippase)